jgi:hypothetical protein
LYEHLAVSTVRFDRHVLEELKAIARRRSYEEGKTVGVCTLVREMAAEYVAARSSHTATN